MGRVLKYKKYDPNGYLIKEQFKTYYVAETPDGDLVKISKKPGGNPNMARTGEFIKNHPKARTSTFHDRKEDQQKGHVAARLSGKKASEESWRTTQRGCLRKMLQMPTSELYTYLVKWGLKSVAQVKYDYNYVVTDLDLERVDQREPNTMQTLCLTMVLRAQMDGKFALQILEMLEGKAVNQNVLQTQMKEEAEKKETPKEQEVSQTIAQIRNMILDKVDNNE